MLVAWRRIDEVPLSDESRPWLDGVARKVLGNRQRADGRLRRLTQRLALEVGELVIHPTEHVPDQLWVRAALRALDDVDREVLTFDRVGGAHPE